MKQLLHDGWTLDTNSHLEFEVASIPATVPGCVHTDLLAADLIPEPYFGENENELQWLGERDWTYTCNFEVSDDLLAHEHVELVCEGLDTMATLSLNGVEIATTESMHLGYRFAIKPQLKAGKNTLSIHFASALHYAQAQVERVGFMPNSGYPLPFNFIRKMACNFGWDWGPTFITAGVWQPIYLQAWNTARIASVRPLVTEANEAEARLNVHVDVAGGVDGLELTHTLTDPLGEAVLSRTSAELSSELHVENPQLWWPAGHGEQPLYTLKVTLTQNGKTLDTWTSRVGLRQVRLDTELDDIGSKFVLEINGKAIFCKGANWIPDDCFVTRVTPERYLERILQAKDANMNMLRIWGGGIYETDAFYNLCDELGIMVWQDFLFACATYSEEEPFASLVEEEAKQQVTRLAKHPSLVVWNGNNENLWGYLDWEQHGKSWREWVGDKSWGNGYYFELLPDILEELDPSRPYTPGSPYSDAHDIRGIHPLSENHGTMHIWDAWNRFDYDVYRRYVPRFASEFGHQAPPTFATLKESIPEAELQPVSPAMLHHQKAHGGNDKLHRRLAEHFDIPEDIHDWHYLTQLNQARALKTGCEWFRANAPRTFGTLYWQLNDCWPVTSWSAVDGYGRKKLLWYATKRFYADRLLTIQPKGNERFLYLINDHDDSWQAEAKVTRQDFSGEVKAEDSFEIQIPPRSVKSVQLSQDIAKTNAKQDELILAQADDHRAIWFFDIDKNLNYPEPDFDLSLNGDTLQLYAKSFLRDVCVFVDKLESDASANDQLITLLPGETYDFSFDTPRTFNLEELESSDIIKTANTFGKNRNQV